jgi:hypothetical protein
MQSSDSIVVEDWRQDASLGPGWRIGLGILSGVIVLIVAAAAVSGAMNSLRFRLHEVGTNYLPSQLALTRAEAATFKVQRDVRSAILIDDPQEIERLLHEAQEQLAVGARALASYKALPMSETERGHYAEYESARHKWQRSMEEAMREVAKNTEAADTVATAIIMERNMPYVREMDRLLEALLGEQVRLCEQALKDADATYGSLFGMARSEASGTCRVE